MEMIFDVAPAARPAFPCLSCVIPLYYVLFGGVFALTAAPQWTLTRSCCSFVGYCDCPHVHSCRNISSYHVKQTKFSCSGTWKPRCYMIVDKATLHVCQLRRVGERSDFCVLTGLIAWTVVLTAGSKRVKTWLEQFKPSHFSVAFIWIYRTKLL